jgi:hypothetical protein
VTKVTGCGLDRRNTRQLYFFVSLYGPLSPRSEGLKCGKLVQLKIIILFSYYEDRVIIVIIVIIIICSADVALALALGACDNRKQRKFACCGQRRSMENKFFRCSGSFASCFPVY